MVNILTKAGPICWICLLENYSYDSLEDFNQENSPSVSTLSAAMTLCLDIDQDHTSAPMIFTI